MHRQLDLCITTLFQTSFYISKNFQKISLLNILRSLFLYIISEQKMQKEAIFIALTLILALIGVNLPDTMTSSLTVAKQPQTVPYVDVASYLGTWYEQAVIPYYFQRECTKTIAKYSLRDDGNVRVDNSCVRNGKLVESVGKAIPEDQTHAKLKVEFVQTLDVGAQYWIVRLAKDYSYSVVSSPNYKYMWILYRQPNMPDALYNEIIADLKKDDFPVEKLQRTQQ